MGARSRGEVGRATCGEAIHTPRSVSLVDFHGSVRIVKASEHDGDSVG